MRKNEGIMLVSNLISMYCSHCKVLGYRYSIFPLTDMERVLARQEKNPHVLNEAQLSIRIYNEFLESEEGVVPDDSGGLETPAGGMDQTQVSQQSETKTQSAGKSGFTGANVKEQSRLERNQLLVCGLSTSTTEDGVVNFIEMMSGEEVKEVTLRNNKALITMASDIAGN